MRRTSPEAGFTLVEMVVSMTLMGILAVAAVPMLRLPMAAYMDTQRRTDALQSADAVHRTLDANLAQALPGSLRLLQVGNRSWLEYLEVRASGRHRAGASGAAQACPSTCSGAGNNDVLQAACSETCFTVLGPLEGAAPVAGRDWVVVNAQGPGVAGGDPWLGGSTIVAAGIKSRLRATAAAADGLRLDITAKNFPATAPSRRVYIVSQPVSWECDPDAGRLTRRWGYAISATQPTTFGAAPNAPLASGVLDCRFSVTPAGAEGRSTVELRLRLARNDGAVGSVEATTLVSTFDVGAR